MAGEAYRMLREFSPYLLDRSSVFRMLAIAVASVIAMSGISFKEKKDVKNILRFLLHFAAVLGLLIAFNICYILVVSMLLNELVGTSFSLALISGILTYGICVRNYGFKERITLAALLSSTAVVMMEWSFPTVTDVLEEYFRIPASAVTGISDVLIVLFAVFLRKISIAEYEISPLHAILTWIEAALVTGSTLFFEMMPLSLRSQKGFQEYIFLNFTILYIVNVLTYTFSYLVTKERQRLLEMEIVEQKKTAELDLLRLSESNLQELREVRHDIKNHCIYMKNMIEEKRYEDLKEYFEQFTGKFAGQLFSYIDYGNKIVTAIVNLEKSKAEAAGVRLNANIVVPPILPFEEDDFCSLTMNLLDNAIEECQRTEKERVVNLIMNTQRGAYFYLCVTNPTNKRQEDIADQGMHTSKSDKSRHGYGMNIIRKTVVKYDGHFSYSIEKGTFIAEVLLNMDGKGEKHE